MKQEFNGTSTNPSRTQFLSFKELKFTENKSRLACGRINTMLCDLKYVFRDHPQRNPLVNSMILANLFLFLFLLSLIPIVNFFPKLNNVLFLPQFNPLSKIIKLGK